MHDLGPETPDERRLREWFDEQERKNLDRLEEGAKTLSQLITGLYGVLFAVLALSGNPAPAYLKDSGVRWLATVCLFALFLALVSAFAVVWPARTEVQRDNLSAMRRALQHLQQRKMRGLQIAFVLFLVGIAALAALILRILCTFS